MRRLPAHGDVVHPPHQHAQPADGLVAHLVGRAPAPAVGEAVENTLHPAQRAAVREGAHRADGDLLGGEVRHELVLFQDLLLAPPPRPVELRHHPGAVRQLHLVDPVLERVEGVADGIALEAAGLDGRQHFLGREGEEEVGFGRRWVRHAANVAKKRPNSPHPARLRERGQG